MIFTTGPVLYSPRNGHWYSVGKFSFHKWDKAFSVSSTLLVQNLSEASGHIPQEGRERLRCTYDVGLYIYLFLLAVRPTLWRRKSNVFRQCQQAASPSSSLCSVGLQEDWWIEKNLRGSGCRLKKVLIQHLPGGPKENCLKPARSFGISTEIRTIHNKNTSLERGRYANSFGRLPDSKKLVNMKSSGNCNT